MSQEEANSKEDKYKQCQEIMNYIGAFIRKDYDGIRAKLYWNNTLDKVPKEVIVDALSMALSSGRYQEKPRCQCRCCNH
jgi:hypothetical protein